MTHTPPLFQKSFVSPEAYDAFFSVVGRLEATMDSEIDALAKGRHGQLADVTRQKRQGFLELNRIMKSFDQTIPSQDIIARLDEFRRRLSTNSATLATHLKAAQEVTDIIMGVMRDAESDGTYSSNIGASAGYDYA